MVAFCYRVGKRLHIQVDLKLLGATCRSSGSLRRRDDLLRGVGQVGGAYDVYAARDEILRPSSTSVPSSRTTRGTLKPTVL